MQTVKWKLINKLLLRNVYENSKAMYIEMLCLPVKHISSPVMFYTVS